MNPSPSDTSLPIQGFLSRARRQRQPWPPRGDQGGVEGPGGSPGGAVVKNLLASAGDARDMGSIPGSGISPGVGNGNLLQYSCLENSTDRGAWWDVVHRVAKSRTRLREGCQVSSVYEVEVVGPRGRSEPAVGAKADAAGVTALTWGRAAKSQSPSEGVSLGSVWACLGPGIDQEALTHPFLCISGLP